jgi:hypothetical protein
MRFSLVLIIAIVLSGCGATVEATFTAVGEAEQTPTPSAPACDPAPAWLVAAILGGMTWDGATLEWVFVVPAGSVSGPAVVEGDAFATSWLVAGTIGWRVRKDGVWITNSLDERNPGLLIAVNPAARHYSTWGSDLPPGITAEGFDHALACAQSERQAGFRPGETPNQRNRLSGRVSGARHHPA